MLLSQQQALYHHKPTYEPGTEQQHLYSASLSSCLVHGFVINMSIPEDKRWPPVPPDVDRSAIEVETPELSITGNSMLYRVKGHPRIVYKARAELREYRLQKAAGACAIPVRGRVMLKLASDGDVDCMGFLMDLATPITVPTGPAPPPAPVLPPS